MTGQRKRIFIIAGDASGDLLVGQLATSLRALGSAPQLMGMGGKEMVKAGVDVFIGSDPLAVVGFFEIFRHFRGILAAHMTLKKRFKETAPHVCIDYPGFNLSLARYVKK